MLPSAPVHQFSAGKEWKQYHFAIKDFSGCDGRDIMAVFFGGSPEPGEFAFQLDDVRFEGDGANLRRN